MTPAWEGKAHPVWAVAFGLKEMEPLRHSCGSDFVRDAQVVLSGLLAKLLWPDLECRTCSGGRCWWCNCTTCGGRGYVSVRCERMKP